jgi:hypothetical protein
MASKDKCKYADDHGEEEDAEESTSSTKKQKKNDATVTPLHQLMTFRQSWRRRSLQRRK